MKAMSVIDFIFCKTETRKMGAARRMTCAGSRSVSLFASKQNISPGREKKIISRSRPYDFPE